MAGFQLYGVFGRVVHLDLPRTVRYYLERWNAALFVPSVREAVRDGGDLRLWVSNYADKASYKFVTSGTQTVSGFSTRTDLTATFSSAGTSEQTPLPVRTVRYKPDVDAQNTVKRTPVTVLPIVLDGTPGAVLPKVKKLQVQVSGDNGTTWKAASVVPSGAGYKAVFPTPAGTSVSLKARLIDAADNTTEQTVIAAYPLR